MQDTSPLPLHPPATSPTPPQPSQPQHQCHFTSPAPLQLPPPVPPHRLCCCRHLASRPRHLGCYLDPAATLTPATSTATTSTTATSNLIAASNPTATLDP